MKLRNYLENIADVGIYPVITLLIFFIFFSLLTAWTIWSRKQKFSEISQLPLEESEQNTPAQHLQ